MAGTPTALESGPPKDPLNTLNSTGRAGSLSSTTVVNVDQVSVDWGGLAAVTVTLNATNITNHYVDVLVPWSIISQQAYGSTVDVSATIISAATGNTSLRSEEHTSELQSH